MAITFNKTKAFNEAKNRLSEILANTEATPEQLSEAYDTYFNVLQTEVANEVTKQINAEQYDHNVLAARGQNVLTSEERKFFNAVIEEGGFTDESVLPVTIQERVFDDLVKERPILAAIGLQNLGAVTRIITSDPKKAYAWGPLFGEIKGQVNAAFSDQTITQLKLTAFAVVPKDMLELGPEWMERYTRTLLVESYKVGMEYGFINGKGPTQNEPIGLMKDVNKTTGAITDKKSSGKLTFAPSPKGLTVVGELYGVIKELSVNEKKENRTVLNKVVMVVNPVDLIAVQARNTIQTDAGTWVTSLPYNIQVIDSEEVPAGKALFFVQGEYLAAVAGGYQINKFDQTLAIEDAMLYTMKQFATGRPKDNKAALVYDLEIDFTTDPGATGTDDGK